MAHRPLRLESPRRVQQWATTMAFMTKKNVKVSFAEAGLIPFNSERILAKLPQRTPKPPASVLNPPTLVSKTRPTTADLQRQIEMIEKERHRRATACSSDGVFERVTEGCEMATQNAALLKAENAPLRAANARQKRQQTIRHKAIAKDSILTIDEGLDTLGESQSQQQAQVEAQIDCIETEASVPKNRAASKSSLYASPEHNTRTCPRR